MSKKMFTIGIPCIFTGILAVVVMGIYGLNNMDKTLAEENAKAAFARVYSDFVESEVDMTKFLNLYENDKFSHSGTFLFTETEQLNNSYVSLLKNVPVEYSIIRCPQNRTTKVNFLLKGDGHFQLDGYVDDNNITFKIEEFFNGYFSIPNNNIKETYNESVWFNLIGDVLTALPDEFSLDLYPQTDVRDYVISDFLKKCSEQGISERILSGLYFEKTDVQKDFFVGNTYVATNEYIVTVSRSAMEDIISLIAQYAKIDEDDIWEADKSKFRAYISTDNRLLGAKFIFDISYKKVPYETEVLFSFLGKENVFDKSVIDISLKGQDNSVYSFRILLNNEIQDIQQVSTLIIAMNQPYVSRLCEVKLNRDIISNEVGIYAAVNLPGLKGNISYTGEIYDKDLLAPSEPYKVYELNLWQTLNIYSSINWSFIK